MIPETRGFLINKKEKHILTTTQTKKEFEAMQNRFQTMLDYEWTLKPSFSEVDQVSENSSDCSLPRESPGQS